MRVLRRTHPVYHEVNNPWNYGLADLFREIDWMLAPQGENEDRAFPACDIREDKKAYLLALDLPGVKRKDIEVAIEGNRLTIKANRAREHFTDDAQTRLVERKTGKFMREFTLPEGTDADKINADYEDGVLHLHIPKQETHKRFKLNVGQGRAMVKGEYEEKDKIKIAN